VDIPSVQDIGEKLIRQFKLVAKAQSCRLVADAHVNIDYLIVGLHNAFAEL